MLKTDITHFPQVFKIKRIVEESPTVKTFYFPWKFTDESPGQFLMIWNFQDEKPMSISSIDRINDEVGVSVKMVGSFTQSLHKLNENDLLGLRGPYGRGFQIAGSKVLAVGGGIGMAPIAAFADEASKLGVGVDLITAATTKEETTQHHRN